MDPKELIKEFLEVKFLLLPNPRLDQNQNILQELLQFSEIFEGGTKLFLSFPEALLEDFISLWALFRWSISV